MGKNPEQVKSETCLLLQDSAPLEIKNPLILTSSKNIVFACILLLCIGLVSCQEPVSENSFQYSTQTTFQGLNLLIHLEPRSIGGYWMLSSHPSVHLKEYPIKYPVYRLASGDVNGDQSPEVLIGVVKKTPYDSVMRKRLFIYQIKEKHWEPLWLGSRVSQPLEDFALIFTGEEMRVRTIEKEQNGLYLVGEYRYGNFGLNFIQYLHRNLNLQRAKKYLNP